MEISAGVDSGQARHRLRRSTLVTPCDPRIMAKAARTDADVIRLELEDGVPAGRKAEARAHCCKGLRDIDWGHREVWVRICHFSYGLAEADVDELVAARAGLIMMGKVEGPEDIVQLDEMVTAAEMRHEVPAGTIKIGCVIERIRALARVEEIAACSPRMSAMNLGLDDLSIEYGYRLTRLPANAPETLYARSRFVLAGHLAGVDCIDYPYLAFHDLESSAIDARFSAQLGFDGKSTISPRQIDAINRAFLPTDKEIAWAQNIMEQVRKADDPDTVVHVVGGAMVDAPHVIQAQQILGRSALVKQRTEGMSPDA